MASITTIQDYLIAQPTTPDNPVWKLERKILSTDTSLVVNFEPKADGATITSDFLIGIETSGYVETMLVTNVSGTTLTVVRGIALAGLDFAGAAGNAVAHNNKSKIFTNISAPMLNMVMQGLLGVISTDIKFSTRPQYDTAAAAAVPVYADATARDAALTAPAEGDECYVTSVGKQFYNSASWDTVGITTAITASLGCERVTNDIRLDLAATNDIVKLTGNELDTNLTSTKTELDQLAGTTNMAEADTFFGATDMSGAEAETLTDGSDASQLHKHEVKSGLTSPTFTAGTGTATIAHGLGVVPKFIEISAGKTSAYSYIHSEGSYDGTSNICIYGGVLDTSSDLAQGSTNSSNIFYLVFRVSTSNFTLSASATVDSTNITLSFNNTNSSSHSANIKWTAYA